MASVSTFTTRSKPKMRCAGAKPNWPKRAGSSSLPSIRSPYWSRPIGPTACTISSIKRGVTIPLSLCDLAGDSWRTVVHPDDIEIAKRQWRTCLETGTPFHAEVRLRRADGQYRWHTLRRVPLRDANDAVIRWYGVGSDIEEQKRAETALQQSEAHLAEAQEELQVTIDTIPTLVASYWPDGT